MYKNNLKGFTLLIPILLLVPGRIQGYYYRNFFNARRLLGRKSYLESTKYNNEFINEIRLKPWKKKLIWLSWGVYSKDIEAMALNNLGSAYLYLGKFSMAEENFNKALELDELYPIPYYNLSILANIENYKDKSEKLYLRAEELGFKGTTFDKVIQVGQHILAQIESDKDL